MWKYITKMGGDFCNEEISEDILPLAQSSGLCCRVKYDPGIHGQNIYADPGDEIWWWGDKPETDQEEVGWKDDELYCFRCDRVLCACGCWLKTEGGGDE